MPMVLCVVLCSQFLPALCEYIYCVPSADNVGDDHGDFFFFFSHKGATTCTPGKVELSHIKSFFLL